MGDKERRILNFVKKHKLAVLATINNEGKPESSVIEFSEKNNLELIFDTFSSFRKYKNIKSNPEVAIVIGWDENITIQYEGTATELKDKELQESINLHINKLQDAKKFVGMEGIKFFKITPKWIRYTDISNEPWEIFEIKF